MSSKSSAAKNETAQEAAIEETAKTESLIYVGPSVPGGTLLRFTVFRGGKPKHLAKLLEDCKEIDRLFVPITKLSEALTKIDRPGTPMHTWFAGAMDFIEKGVK
ncbi:hypothetical protein [Anaerospora hongkongensis]|uniref:hypothetical protein n=1 Tax=Anaerospora hongkongensis TaxID=244830 RepID=UPI002FDB0576